jgi:predicted TIM-barrel fold metal-dependent hydrolase
MVLCYPTIEISLSFRFTVEMFISRAMRIDCHVHIVGNGSSGSGCWIRTKTHQWPLQGLMVRHIGLPISALKGDLDRLYVDKLLQWIRESSLDAAIVLAQEQVYRDDGELMSEYGTAYVPNDYVLQLAREHREFLPAVSIHPARRDALEELERCIAGGAVMMKCLPNCQNIDCMNPHFRKFWERMAEAGIPLLAHTGGEHTLQIVRPEFADPRTLKLPLECGVTVIAAHSASKSGFTDPEYFHHFSEMCATYPTFYGDNSAFNIPIRSRVVPKSMQPPVADKILHGSDYPVPIFGHWAWMRGFIDWSTFRRWQNHANPIERDFQLKKAMGFTEETFTRVAELIPRKALEKLSPSAAGARA